MSGIKNNPLALAVLGVAAWYLLTQRKGAAGMIGNPAYGQQGALSAPGARAYLIPPSGIVPPTPSTAQSVLSIVSSLLGRSSPSAPAPISLAGTAPGYSVMPSTWSWGQSTLNPANVASNLPAVSTPDPNAYAWGGPLVSSSPLTGVYGYNDGAGVIDGVIGNPAPNIDWSMQENDNSSLGYF